MPGTVSSDCPVFVYGQPVDVDRLAQIVGVSPSWILDNAGGINRVKYPNIYTPMISDILNAVISTEEALVKIESYKKSGKSDWVRLFLFRFANLATFEADFVVGATLARESDHEDAFIYLVQKASRICAGE